MKNITSIALVAVFTMCMAAVNATVQAAASDDNGMSNMGSMNSGMDTNSFKNSIEARIDTVNGEISALKGNAKDMSPSQKDTLNMKIAQLEGKRSTVKSMLSSLKTNASPDNREKIENAMADLENSVRDVMSGSVNK
jgi:TolA-binding protein